MAIRWTIFILFHLKIIYKGDHETRATTLFRMVLPQAKIGDKKIRHDSFLQGSFQNFQLLP